MGIILFWIFQLKISNCFNNINLVPFSNEERINLCIDRILREENAYAQENSSRRGTDK